MKRIVFVMALALLVGCGARRQVQKGMDAYDVADYGSSMDRWRALEASEQELNTKGRVRYLVYRGLTHYQLFRQTGNAAEYAWAVHYLRRGSEAYQRTGRNWLPSPIVLEMEQAIAEIGASPVRTIVVQLPADTAPAPTAPPPSDDEEEE